MHLTTCSCPSVEDRGDFIAYSDLFKQWRLKGTHPSFILLKTSHRLFTILALRWGRHWWDWFLLESSESGETQISTTQRSSSPELCHTCEAHHPREMLASSPSSPWMKSALLISMNLCLEWIHIFYCRCLKDLILKVSLSCKTNRKASLSLDGGIAKVRHVKAYLSLG